MLPLSREEMRSVVEGRGCASRIPVLLHQWTNPQAFGAREGEARALCDRFPQDAQVVFYRAPDIYVGPADDPEYRWVNYDQPAGADDHHGLDEQAAIRDWSQLDGIIANFPSPDYPGLFTSNPQPDGRYRIAHWWYGLFERHWSLRGMTHAMLDFYTDPAEVHRLYRAYTDFFLRFIERAKDELQADAIYWTDDLGTQSDTFFSPEIFDRFYRPYYTEIIAKAHGLGMHAWLHSCGNISKILPALVEMGLDVVHPIQKYAMDEVSVARAFGGKIAFWAGFDVQRIIPYGTPEDVRREVRHLMDTYARPDGRFLITAGNGITSDTPLESLRALYEESYVYGKAKVESLRGQGG
jgi:uroporphyrinogen decarboxylase